MLATTITVRRRIQIRIVIAGTHAIDNDFNE